MKLALFLLFAAISFAQPFTYHGGPVLTGGARLYNIYYGATWTDAQKGNVRTLSAGLGGSTYFSGMNVYYDAAHTRIANFSAVLGEFSDVGSQGTFVANDKIALIIQNAITQMGWPCDPKAVYAVLAGSGISGGLGAGGFHFSMPCLGGSQIPALWAMMGSTNAAMEIFTHETVEAISDPFGNIVGQEAWMDAGREEIADVCGTYSYVLLAGGSFRVADYYVNGSGCNSSGGQPPPPPPPPPPPNNVYPPTITITTPLGGSVLPCGSVRFTATASDIEDGNISSKVVWPNSTMASSTTINYGCGGPNLGPKSVTATVTDSGGKSTAATVKFTIRKK